MAFKDFATNVNITDAGWTHVATQLTVDDATGEIAIYINGELVVTGTANERDRIRPRHRHSHWRKRKCFKVTAFNGLIDDARIYTRALSADEILALAIPSNRPAAASRLRVNAVNDAPVVISPGAAYSFIEQGSLPIQGTGFSVSDVDEDGGDLTAVFTVGEGRVLIDPDASGVTVLTGNSTDTVTFSGTAAEINALLDGTSGTITFLHDQTVASDTPSASTTITLTVNDQGNTGSDPGDSGDGASEESFASQTINITSVNDAPTFLGPELVSNGDFSSSNLAGTGWTTTGAAVVQSEQLNFGASNATTENTLSQTINTVDGETYTLSFNYRDRSGGTNTRNQSLVVSVDGDENLLTTEAILTDTDDEIYVRYTFTFTADSATSTIKFTDTSANAGSMSSGTDSSDGRLDNISVKQTDGNLSAVTFVEDSTAVVLDSDLTLSDAEISEGLDNYDGTTLVLNRNGGADSEDVFSATGNLVFDGSQVKFPISGTEQVIGTLTNSDGTLSIQFTNASLTEANINEILQSITYSNTNQAPPSSVQIDWTFNDSNEAAESDPQGTGGSLTATGSTTVNITAVNDAPVLTQNDFSISEGGVLTLTTSNINATDAEGDSITFNITNVTGGGIYVGADGTLGSDESFTMAQLVAGDVVFLHDSSDSPPTFDISVTDGNDASTAVAANITFTEVNDQPFIDSNEFGDVSIINTTLAGDQGQPDSITLSDGSQVVAYSDGSNSYAQRFDSSGNLIGVEITLDDTNSSADIDLVATSDGGFVATWTNDGELNLRRFDASGTPLSASSTTINFGDGISRTRPEITELTNGNLLIGYLGDTEIEEGGSTAAAILLDSSFNVVTAEFIISDDTSVGQFDAKVTSQAGGGFAIAFTDAVDRDGDGHGTFVQFYDATGTAVGTNQQVNVNTDGHQQVFDIAELTNGNVLVAYRDINAGGGFDTFARLYDSTGAALGSPFVVNQSTGGFQNAIDVVPLSDGTFAASWVTRFESGERQVFVRQFDASGNPLTDEMFVASGVFIGSPSITSIGNNAVRISLFGDGDGDAGNGTDIFSRAVSFAPHSVSYTENAAGITLNDSIKLIDFDDTDLTGATLQITGGYVDGEDTLNFTNQNGIIHAWDSVTGTLTLTATGGASIADFETALRSVTYINGSEDPDVSTRSIEWTITDGEDSSYTTTTEVEVVTVNDRPVIADLGGDTLNYIEGDGAVAIDQSAGAVVTDVDSSNFETGTLTVAFTAGSDSAEDMSFDHQSRNRRWFDAGAGQIGISGSDVTYEGTIIGTFTGGSSGTDLVITLNASADEAAVSALVQQISYQNTDTDNPTTSDRTVRYILTDGDGGTSIDYDTTVSVSRVNDTPNVVGPGTAYTVDEQTNLNIHGTGFSVTDVDAGSGALTATITAGEGSITIVAGNSGVAISSGNGTGSIILTGTLSQINNLLTGTGSGTIVYNNGSDTPAPSTVITVTVNDGGNTGADPGDTANGSSEEDSASQTINLNATNDAPTLTLPDGISIHSFGIFDQARDVTHQDDGKILVAGSSNDGSGDNFLLARFNADGTLDTSFGSGLGYVITDFDSDADLGTEVNVQSDGKIVVSGAARVGGIFQFAIARYNTDGSIDTTYGDSGRVVTDIGGLDSRSNGMAIQSDGKVVVTGFANIAGNRNFAVARYNTDGTLDTSFGGGDGFLDIDVAGRFDISYETIIQPDGKILIGGWSQDADGIDFTVARLNTDGTLDSSFGGGDGIATTPIGTATDWATGMTLQADGRIVLTGYSQTGTDRDIAVVRYNADGSLDTSFGGGDGIVVTSLGTGLDQAYQVATQSDGKLIVVGQTASATVVLRYNTDGTLDSTFADSGVHELDLADGDESARGVSIDPDDKIVVFGQAMLDANQQLTLVRLNADGSPDTGFDSFNNDRPTYTENGTPVVLDGTVEVFDAELSDGDNFDGSTLTLVRNLGPHSDDVYSAAVAGTLNALTEGGSLVVDSTTIGTITTNSAGTLVLTFNSNATNALVNSAMQQIAYSNSSEAPPASVQIDWTFNDGNTADAQGTGPSESAIGSTTVDIIAVNDAPVISDGPDTSTLLETNAGLTDNGTLTVTDADETDTVTASVDSVVVTGTGSTSVPAGLNNAAIKAFLTVNPTEILDEHADVGHTDLGL